MVRIDCSEGYGVQELGYNQTQDVVCGRNVTPLPCTRSDGDNYPVLVGMSALALMLMVIIGLLLCDGDSKGRSSTQRKRSEKRPMPPKEPATV